MKTIDYLACPYKHKDPSVMYDRFVRVNRAAAKMMKLGLHIFSPISHTHPIACEGDLPRGWDYWESYDTAMLGCCRRLIILKLPGWEQSKGIEAETRVARVIGIPTIYVTEDMDYGFLLSQEQKKVAGVQGEREETNIAGVLCDEG